MDPLPYRITGRDRHELSDSLRRGIADGHFPPGSLLPSRQSIAELNHLSMGPVNAAFWTLLTSGVLIGDGRRGTRVAGGAASSPRAAKRLSPADPRVLDLSTGQPSTALLPPIGPQVRMLPVDTAAAPPTAIWPALRTAAAARLEADHAPAKHLTVTSGGLDGIDRVLGASLAPGATVAVEDPCWPGLLGLVRALGCTPLPLAVDASGPDPDSLRAALSAGCEAVVVTGRAQNPTGAGISAKRAKALRALLTRHKGVVVIEDDPCPELATVPLSTLTGVTTHWALVRSVSLVWGPDFRLAVLSGDAETVRRVDERMRVGSGWVSSLLQHMLADLWEWPASARRIERSAERYAQHRVELVEALAERGVVATGESGVNVWVSVPDEQAAVRRALHAGFAVAAGADFRLESGPGVRVTVGDLSSAEVPALADALAG